MKQLGARLANWMLIVRGRACPRASDSVVWSCVPVNHTCASGGRVVGMDVGTLLLSGSQRGSLFSLTCWAVRGQALSAWSPGSDDRRGFLPRWGSWAEIPILQLKMLLILDILLVRLLPTLSRNGKGMLVFYMYSISNCKKTSVRQFLALSVSRTP